MSIIIRPLNENDYDDILVHWWKDWNWTPPNKDFLPDNGKGGMIVFDDETPVCAGFVYMTNSSVAWVDWIVSSKTYRKKPTRKECMHVLIDTMTDVCKKIGCKYVYALIKNSSLIETYKSVGYGVADSYNKEMIKAF